MIIRRSKKTQPTQKEQAPIEEKNPEPAQIEEFDISKIEFHERSERRRGDRRRGYRRIDERNLVSRALLEADSIRENAHSEGYKSGLNQVQNDLDELKNTLLEFMGAKEQVYEEVSKDILEIAVEIAKKIIKKEVSLCKEILLNVITDVLHEVSQTETRIMLKVSPNDLQYTKENMPDILSNSQIDAKVLISADENIEEGSCLIQTNNGIVDANFSTQLEIVKRAIGVQENTSVGAIADSIEIMEENLSDEVEIKEDEIIEDE